MIRKYFHRAYFLEFTVIAFLMFLGETSLAHTKKHHCHNLNSFNKHYQLYGMEVLIDGVEQRRFDCYHQHLFEAIKDKNYTIRLYNNTKYRVGVALSVDGLNTIDAKRTSAYKARKWIIPAYSYLNVKGWQVSDEKARQFVFVSEKDSYAKKLGKVKNLGVIEAVFFAEKTPKELLGHSHELKKMGPKSKAKPASPQSGASVDFAATGMGTATENKVKQVAFQFEKSPVFRSRLRYEFKKELIRLGVQPSDLESNGQIRHRRNNAGGFANTNYAPEL